jgi:hypothetical protein
MGLMGLMGLQQQQQQQQGLELSVRQQSVPLSVPVATVLEAPEVQIQHSRLFNYWLVSIRCRDRNKLFFDTVCTLSDMRYDTYHATIDAEPNGMAQQLFYIRPRLVVPPREHLCVCVLTTAAAAAMQHIELLSLPAVHDTLKRTPAPLGWWLHAKPVTPVSVQLPCAISLSSVKVSS